MLIVSVKGPKEPLPPVLYEALQKFHGEVSLIKEQKQQREQQLEEERLREEQQKEEQQKEEQLKQEQQQQENKEKQEEKLNEEQKEQKPAAEEEKEANTEKAPEKTEDTPMEEVCKEEVKAEKTEDTPMEEVCKEEVKAEKTESSGEDGEKADAKKRAAQTEAGECMLFVMNLCCIKDSASLYVSSFKLILKHMGQVISLFFWLRLSDLLLTCYATQ
jgi:DNA mismatch repair ATPase MutL